MIANRKAAIVINANMEIERKTNKKMNLERTDKIPTTKI